VDIYKINSANTNLGLTRHVNDQEDELNYLMEFTFSTLTGEP